MSNLALVNQPGEIEIKDGILSVVSIRCLFCESDQLEIVDEGEDAPRDADPLTLPIYQCECHARCIVKSNESLLWQLPVDIDIFPPTYGEDTPETMDAALERTLNGK